MKAKVPNKTNGLTFTMLDKGYVDLGIDLIKGLKDGGFLDVRAFKPDQVGYFDVNHRGARFTFKVYKPKARRGGHNRLTLERKVVRSLNLVLGDALFFDFTIPGKISLTVSRTGIVSSEDEKRLRYIRPTFVGANVLSRKKPDGFYNPIPARAFVIRYCRDQNVAAWILRHANGICELCQKLAPFNDNHGLPFLETHHIKFLSDGGPDIVKNVVALCPNCHRKCHYSSDIGSLADQLMTVAANRQWT